MASKDYYKILEVPRTATEQEIKTSYRRMARLYHPDVNPNNKQAEERFKEIGEAYEVLGNAEKRKKYDQWGVDWEKYDKVGSNYGNAGWGTGTNSGYNTRDSGFGDYFDQIFGGNRQNNRTGRTGTSNTYSNPGQNTNPNFNYGRNTAPRPQRGEDREQSIDLSLEETYNGTLRQLQIQTSEMCNICNGNGIRNGQRCANCSGLGVMPRAKRLEVRVPAGIEEGSKIRVAGEGGAGIGNGPRGDLFLKVHLQPHPLFERQGNDLYITLTVPLYTALLGGELEVPSLKGGKFMLKVPADTPNNKLFRLSGLGMPILNQPANRGDMYVKVMVVLPTNLSTEERELFRQLREIRPQ
jgi:molecular chaperone DnaJ/curved DNA-binding protein